MEDEDDDTPSSFQETKSIKTALHPQRDDASEGIVGMNEKKRSYMHLSGVDILCYFESFSISGRLTTHQYRSDSQVA